MAAASPSPPAGLESLRAQIDAIDRDLLVLLVRRRVEPRDQSAQLVLAHPRLEDGADRRGRELERALADRRIRLVDVLLDFGLDRAPHRVALVGLDLLLHREPGLAHHLRRRPLDDVARDRLDLALLQREDALHERLLGRRARRRRGARADLRRCGCGRERRGDDERGTPGAAQASSPPPVGSSLSSPWPFASA